MVILENIDIDIDIDKAILQNIDIDKISNRFKFGISNRAISEVLRAIVSSGKLPESCKNSFLVFSPKINKESSTRIKDKRKLSLLQTDFKILTGVLAGRLRKTEQHTISRYQFATGGKRISEAVCLTRDAIESL